MVPLRGSSRGGCSMLKPRMMVKRLMIASLMVFLPRQHASFCLRVRKADYLQPKTMPPGDGTSSPFASAHESCELKPRRSPRWQRSSFAGATSDCSLAILHTSQRRLRKPVVCEMNQLDRRTFGHRRARAVCTYSLSEKMCRYSLNDSP